MPDGRFDAVLRSLTESRRSVLGGAAAVALLGFAERGAARKKPKKKKGKADCPKALKKINGRCARPCQDAGSCGGAGYCMATFDDGDVGPKVCVLIGGLFALDIGEQCDLLGERPCNLPSDCGAKETCVVHSGCVETFCAATQFP